MAQSLNTDREDQSDDTFEGRMEAQCDQIRRYRAEVIRKDGRMLSYDEAALEWIERYAEGFAREHDAAWTLLIND